MIAFTKMHGIGNDFIVVDGVGQDAPSVDLPKLSVAVNDRKFGVGGDGLILVERGESAPFRMRMFNPDGSESEMCGNGIRCVANLLSDRGYLDSKSVEIETGAGVLAIELGAEGWVTVDMGPARLERSQIPVAGDPESTFIDQPVHSSAGGLNGTAVSMGNPHLVVFVDDVQAVNLEVLGQELETNKLFPNRINVHFVQAVSSEELVQRTWERGAGPTLACGTGACAAVVAGFQTRRTDRKATVHLPGGDLRIEYRENGHVLMSGPAETVFTGSWNPAGD